MPRSWEPSALPHTPSAVLYVIVQAPNSRHFFSLAGSSSRLSKTTVRPLCLFERVCFDNDVFSSLCSRCQCQDLDLKRCNVWVNGQVDFSIFSKWRTLTYLSLIFTANLPTAATITWDQVHNILDVVVGSSPSTPVVRPDGYICFLSVSYLPVQKLYLVPVPNY